MRIVVKKVLVFVLVTVVFCSGCSGSQNEKNQTKESQNEMEATEETENPAPEEVNEKDTEKGSLTDSSDTSASNIDYGTTANEFLDSAPVSGIILDLTDSSFVTGPGFATGDPADEVFTDVVYDKETVRIKTATVNADANSFSVNDGQKDDLVEKAFVQVYGNAQEDGAFQAVEIIVLTFESD